VRGSVDALSENVRRLARRERELGLLGLSESERGDFLRVVEALAAAAADRRVASPAEVRRRARELTSLLSGAGVPAAEMAARALAELDGPLDPASPPPADAHAELTRFLLQRPSAATTETLVGYLQEYAYLYRNVAAIQTAIKQIQRIVGALKGYSHLDQAKIEPADLHEGIENTLVILHHELKYGILIQRKYGDLPRVPVYVDELNQVWTNIIHNAVQALKGKGEIVIETLPPGSPGEDSEPKGRQPDTVTIRVIDNGPGIPEDVLPRIFEPFFTTKVKGEGTGLGLGIVKKIIEKHGGRVDVDSRPGRTCFTIVLPVSGPPGRHISESRP
jgi:signal transduction histidine kinase